MRRRRGALVNADSDVSAADRNFSAEDLEHMVTYEEYQAWRFAADDVFAYKLCTVVVIIGWLKAAKDRSARLVACDTMLLLMVAGALHISSKYRAAYARRRNLAVTLIRLLGIVAAVSFNPGTEQQQGRASWITVADKLLLQSRVMQLVLTPPMLPLPALQLALLQSTMLGGVIWAHAREADVAQLSDGFRTACVAIVRFVNRHFPDWLCGLSTVPVLAGQGSSYGRGSGSSSDMLTEHAAYLHVVCFLQLWTGAGLVWLLYIIRDASMRCAYAEAKRVPLSTMRLPHSYGEDGRVDVISAGALLLLSALAAWCVAGPALQLLGPA